MPLVELVEADRADAVEERVLHHLAHQHPLGHEAQPGLLADLGVAADLVADQPAELTAELVGDALRGRARSEPPRLEHHDLLAVPDDVQERRRHAGGLAGAGRRHQQGCPAALQGGEHVGQRRIDRQRLSTAHGDAVTTGAGAPRSRPTGSRS